MVPRVLSFLSAAVALCAAGPALAATSVFYDFESGSTAPWVVAADPGISPTYGISGPDSACPAPSGRHLSLNAPINFTPGGEWAFSRYVADPGTYTVTVRYAIRNQANCSNCRAMAAVRNGWINSSTAFTVQGPVGTTGWLFYSHTATVTLTTSGAIGVAVGWRGWADNPALPTRVGLDCIGVYISP